MKAACVLDIYVLSAESYAATNGDDCNPQQFRCDLGDSHRGPPWPNSSCQLRLRLLNKYPGPAPYHNRQFEHNTFPHKILMFYSGKPLSSRLNRRGIHVAMKIDVGNIKEVATRCD